MSNKTRLKSLQTIGFTKYGAYLKSPLWKAIRAKILRRAKYLCEVCGKSKAIQVHHRSYSLRVMTGQDLKSLVACCERCHYNSEYSGPRKLSLKLTNLRMCNLAMNNGKILPYTCRGCKHRFVKEDANGVCGVCKKKNQPNYLPKPNKYG